MLDFIEEKINYYAEKIKRIADRFLRAVREDGFASAVENFGTYKT